MIIVTGGAGFIGANLVKKINKSFSSDVIVVDNIKKNTKNINSIKFKDYYDKDEFSSLIEKNKIKTKIKSIIHLGACTNTTENNWDYLNYNNIIYTKKLYEFSLSKNCQFIYASSASIYGKKSGAGAINNFNYKPLNLYGKSKFELDKYFFKKSNKKVLSLRFFNVYGNLEYHKKDMRSPVSKFLDQLAKKKYIKLFKLSKEPSRDFIHVNDAINMIFFLKKKVFKGIFNIGTGNSETFLNIAKLIIQKKKYGEIRYINMPEELRNKYQFYTKANISFFKRIKYKKKLLNLKTGIDLILR